MHYVHGSLLLAGVEHLRVQLPKRGGEALEVGALGRRDQVGIVGGPHVPMGLHG
jgi:hypothetical protein